MNLMKRVILLILALNILNCKGARDIPNNIDLNFFLVEKQTNKNLILLTKKSSKLKTHGETVSEPAYSLEVPMTLNYINSSISIIPNEIELNFDSNQKVLIFGNKNEIEVDKVSLAKDSFSLELNRIHISNKMDSIINSKLKNNRFFGIYSKGKYMFVYLNVKEKNVPMFNNVIKSQLVLVSASTSSMASTVPSK